MPKKGMCPLSPEECFYKSSDGSISKKHYQWIRDLIKRSTATDPEVKVETIIVDDDNNGFNGDDTRETDFLSKDEALARIEWFVNYYDRSCDLTNGHICYNSGCVTIVFEHPDYVYGRCFVALRACFIRKHDIRMAEKDKLVTARALARANRTVDDADDISFPYQLFD